MSAVIWSEGPYLLGGRRTCGWGSQIGWGTRIGNLEMRPAFKPYLERLFSRPAAKRGREIDEALVPKSA